MRKLSWILWTLVLLALLLCVTLEVTNSVGKTGETATRESAEALNAFADSTETEIKEHGKGVVEKLNSELDQAELQKARTTVNENEEIARALAKMNRSFKALNGKTDQLTGEMNKLAQASTPRGTESRTASSPTQR